MAPPCPPPRLRSSERGSGSLHLTQRFSNLISSRRAKGWRPRPDLPGNGVCVKRFLWRGGTCSPVPPAPPTPPKPPYRPRCSSCCCVMKRVFKLSTGESTLERCCSGGRAGPPWWGEGRNQSCWSRFKMSPGSFLSFSSSSLGGGQTRGKSSRSPYVRSPNGSELSRTISIICGEKISS